MSDPLFKYTLDPADFATAQQILDETEALAGRQCSPTEISEALARLDGLIAFLEGKVDEPAKLKLIPALRIKAQFLLKLGNGEEAVSHLNQALELTSRHGTDAEETAILLDLLSEHSPEFRRGLEDLARIGGAIPCGS